MEKTLSYFAVIIFLTVAACEGNGNIGNGTDSLEVPSAACKQCAEECRKM